MGRLAVLRDMLERGVSGGVVEHHVIKSVKNAVLASAVPGLIVSKDSAMIQYD